MYKYSSTFYVANSAPQFDVRDAPAKLIMRHKHNLNTDIDLLTACNEYTTYRSTTTRYAFISALKYMANIMLSKGFSQ